MKNLVCESLYEYNKYLQGGKGDKLTRSEVDSDQLEIGIAVEMEHTDNKSVAEEIALDHLAEDKEYYTKLMKAELADEPEAIKLYQRVMKFK